MGVPKVLALVLHSSHTSHFFSPEISKGWDWKGELCAASGNWCATAFGLSYMSMFIIVRGYVRTVVTGHGEFAHYYPSPAS